MQIYLGTSPGDYSAAAPLHRQLAHVAYRIGEHSSLLRQPLPDTLRGGLLALSDRCAPSISAPDALAAAILRECKRRNFSGVLLDFEGEHRQDLFTAALRLGRALKKEQKCLFAPASLANGIPEAIPLLCTAVSGGSLSQYLQETQAKYHGRFALDVQRLRMDFSLPAPSGEGRSLTAAQLRELQNRAGSPVFFSQDLCAKYFTYLKGTQGHLVLFDDADTMGQKLRMAASLNCPAAFLMWPEVQDIASQLLR